MLLGTLERHSFFEPRLFHSVGLKADTKMLHFVTFLTDVAIPASNIVFEYRLAHECSAW